MYGILLYIFGIVETIPFLPYTISMLGYFNQTLIGLIITILFPNATDYHTSAIPFSKSSGKGLPNYPHKGSMKKGNYNPTFIDWA